MGNQGQRQLDWVSGGPEPHPRWRRLFQCCGASAHGGNEVVHEKTVGPGDGAVMLNGLRKAAQYEHTPRGKFAGIFRRRVVSRRQRVRERFYETRQRLRFQAPQHFLFPWRNEARHWDGTMPRLSYDFVYLRLVLFHGLLAREAHRENKWRGDEREIAKRVPSPRFVQYRMADVCAADETIWVSYFPKRSRGVELDVAANGRELSRIKGKNKPEMRLPAEGKGTGESPRTPRGAGRRTPRGGGGGEVVYPVDYVEVGGFVIVYNQEQVDVVGHYHEIGSGERGVFGVLRSPFVYYRFARRHERDCRIVVDARKRFFTPFGAERDEKEFLAAFTQLEMHSNVPLETTTLGGVRGRQRPRPLCRELYHTVFCQVKQWNGGGYGQRIKKRSFRFGVP